MRLNTQEAAKAKKQMGIEEYHEREHPLSMLFSADQRLWYFSNGFGVSAVRNPNGSWDVAVLRWCVDHWTGQEYEAIPEHAAKRSVVCLDRVTREVRSLPQRDWWSLPDNCQPYRLLLANLAEARGEIRELRRKLSEQEKKPRAS